MFFGIIRLSILKILDKGVSTLTIEKISLALAAKNREVFSDGDEIFGYVYEMITKSDNVGFGLAVIYLEGPDVINFHKEMTEIYILLEGEGYLFLDDENIDFNNNKVVTIPPGARHAAKPKEERESLKFLRISKPAFNLDDFYKDPRGRNW